MKKLKTKLASSSLWFILILLVLFRFVRTRPVYKSGQKVRITSRVLQEPARYEYSQRITVAGLKVSLSLFPEIKYGDTVTVEGTVQKNDLKKAVLSNLKESEGRLYQLRQKIVAFYQRSLPEPAASLVSGMVLGSKASIPAEFWEDLKTSGTAHVVVASGMNVSVVASFLMGLFVLFLPRRWAIPLVMAGIGIYCALSGFDAPIIRAAVMGSITLLAQSTGRLASAWRALLFSALVMLIVNPPWLTDLGFLLSFVATASIMLFERRIRSGLLSVPKVLRESFSSSLAAQIGVAPILFVTFGQFNILSPVINALVLWTVPLITVLGGIGGMVGLVFPLTGRIILYLLYPFTWFFIKTVEIFG